MAQKQIVMEQLKQILQLKNDGVSIREIARRIGISRNSVRKYFIPSIVSLTLGRGRCAALNYFRSNIISITSRQFKTGYKPMNSRIVKKS